MKPISKRDVLTRRVPMKKIHRILSFHGVAVCIRAENKTKIKVSCCFLLTERFTFSYYAFLQTILFTTPV